MPRQKGGATVCTVAVVGVRRFQRQDRRLHDMVVPVHELVIFISGLYSSSALTKACRSEVDRERTFLRTSMAVTSSCFRTV